MPIHLSWEDTDQTLLLVESSGKWFWEEYHDALSRMAEMIRNENHRVDIITVNRTDSDETLGFGAAPLSKCTTDSAEQYWPACHYQHQRHRTVNCLDLPAS